MIALYPGAYKPPHSGHFEIASSLLKGMQGRVYSIDNYKEAGPSALSKDSDTSVKVDKVIVFIGAGERNGITQSQSEAIWKIYQNYI